MIMSSESRWYVNPNPNPSSKPYTLRPVPYTLHPTLYLLCSGDIMIMSGESRMYTCLNRELNSKPHILHPTPYLPVRGNIMIISGESRRYVWSKPFPKLWTPHPTPHTLHPTPAHTLNLNVMSMLRESWRYVYLNSIPRSKSNTLCRTLVSTLDSRSREYLKWVVAVCDLKQPPNLNPTLNTPHRLVL